MKMAKNKHNLSSLIHTLTNNKVTRNSHTGIILQALVYPLPSWLGTIHKIIYNKWIESFFFIITFVPCYNHTTQQQHDHLKLTSTDRVISLHIQQHNAVCLTKYFHCWRSLLQKGNFKESPFQYHAHWFIPAWLVTLYAVHVGTSCRFT